MQDVTAPSMPSWSRLWPPVSCRRSASFAGGANKPGQVGAGERLHVVAEVGESNPDHCVFFLEPVSTEVR